MSNNPTITMTENEKTALTLAIRASGAKTNLYLLFPRKDLDEVRFEDAKAAVEKLISENTP